MRKAVLQQLFVAPNDQIAAALPHVLPNAHPSSPSLKRAFNVFKQKRMEQWNFRTKQQTHYYLHCYKLELKLSCSICRWSLEPVQGLRSEAKASADKKAQKWQRLTKCQDISMKRRKNEKKLFAFCNAVIPRCQKQYFGLWFTVFGLLFLTPQLGRQFPKHCCSHRATELWMVPQCNQGQDISRQFKTHLKRNETNEVILRRASSKHFASAVALWHWSLMS